MINLTRIHNDEYVFTDNKTKKEVTIKVDQKIANAEFRYNLAKKTAETFVKQLNSEKTDAAFRLAGKSWHIHKAPKVGTTLKIGGHLTTFVHKHGDDHVIRLEVSEIAQAPTSVSGAAVISRRNFDFATKLLKVNFKRQQHEGTSSVSKEEFERGVREKQPLKKGGLLPINKPTFSDPFTKLATLAFQRYEQNFTSKDNFTPLNCDYRIVKEGSELKLVHKDNKDLNTPENNRETLKLYKEHLIKEYGQEKVDYIQHLYKFNLDQDEALTPEHIYRFNIGVNNLEIQDVNRLIGKMALLQQVSNLDPIQSFEELRNTPYSLTDHEIRGLISVLKQQMGNKEPTVADLFGWVHQLGPLPSSSDQLSPHQLDLLVKIMKFTPEEQQAALTGRRIYTYIQSGYTTADHSEYKPWVDQHELLQTMANLEKSQNMVSYHELLAHVVAKNHLARAHPTEGYRVGALIPVPRGEKAEMRYYKVTSCVNNGYGILSYTLESACPDPTLPALKLMRSTASAPYFQAEDSLLNDFNLLNPPGYEGLGLGDSYEMPFFQERTMPIWTGYLTLANNALAKIFPSKGLNDVYKDLKQANQELHVQFDKAHRRKTLRDVLVTKTNTSTLNDLLFTHASFLGPIVAEKENRFLELYCQLASTYAQKPERTNVSQEALDKEIADAQELITQIDNLPFDKMPMPLQEGIKRLKKDLNDHVISSQNVTKRNKREKAEFESEVYTRASHLQKEAESLLKQEKYPEAKEKLLEWSAFLAQYAESKQETMGYKKQQDITLTGHSLGGALVQSYCSHAIFNPGRMPLPGQTLSVYEFDGPAITDEDNEQAVNLLLQHSGMFERLGVKIKYTRRQEYGDFVPLSGSAHLFSAKSREQETQLTKTKALEMDQAVWRRLPTAKNARIAQALTAHATQFGGGKRLEGSEDETVTEADYTETPYTSFSQYLLDKGGQVGEGKEREDNKKRYIRLYENIWGLSTVKGLWGSDKAEALRTSTNPAGLILRKVITDSAQKDRTLAFQDSSGVLAVTQNGPISKLRDAEILRGIDQNPKQKAFAAELRKAEDLGLITLTPSFLKELVENPKLIEQFDEIQKLREESDPDVKTSKEHTLALKRAEAKLAYAVGVKPKTPDEGVHLTYFMLSLSGKKVGLFKEPDLRVTPVRSVWRWAGEKIGIGQEIILSNGRYAQIAGEKAAYIIKEKLGPFDFELAPVKITSFTDHTGKRTDRGAFLVFCEDVKLAKEVISEIEKETFTEEEELKFQPAVLYDFLLGNLDRHTRNWMAATSEKGELTKVLLIYNSNILPKQEPKSMNIVATKARFGWKNLKIADRPIHPEIKARYLELLEDPDAFVEELFEEINNDPEIRKLFEFEQKTTKDKTIRKELNYFSEESKKAMQARARYLAKELHKATISPRSIAENYKG